MPDPSPTTRARRGGVLILGALAYGLAAGPGPLVFGWTPLALGLVYLAASIVAGRRDGFWPTALVVTGWGAAAALVLVGKVAVPETLAYTVGAALGVLACFVLARRGFAVPLAGVIGSVVAIPLFLLLERSWPAEFAQAETYAYLVGLVGLVNLGRAFQARRATA